MVTGPAYREYIVTINEAKHDVARRSRRGITTIRAGVVLWTTFGVLGMVLPPSPHRALIYLFGAGMVLPIGMLLAALLKIDLFANGNPLGRLGGVLGGLQLLFIPLMIGAYGATPHAVPWYLGVLVGAHFLPFMWVFNSYAYLFCALATTAVAGLSGLVLPHLTFVVTPFAVAGVLLITVVLLMREIAADERMHVAPSALHPVR